MADTPEMGRLICRYIEVYEYPDGQIEVRADRTVLPFVPYDRLSVLDQSAIVENKRLGHVLQIAQLMKDQRDSRRGRSAPADYQRLANYFFLKAVNDEAEAAQHERMARSYL